MHICRAMVERLQQYNLGHLLLYSHAAAVPAIHCYSATKPAHKTFSGVSIAVRARPGRCAGMGLAIWVHRV